MEPETRYAKSGELHVAYQTLGDGPFDLVYVPGFVSNVECGWEEPSRARFLRRLASFSRLILFDNRGTGLSDPVRDAPTLEARMDDLRAVLDAVSSQRATLFGVHEGGSMAALFAATHPSTPSRSSRTGLRSGDSGRSTTRGRRPRTNTSRSWTTSSAGGEARASPTRCS